MSDVGFSVVGLGMGRGRARTIVETAGARLANVCDLDAERARAVGDELECPWVQSLDAALADAAVDVVLVMTPSGLHGDVALQALAAGKHVITTKPMDVSVHRCDEMIAAAAAAKRLLGVDFQERYTDVPQQIKYAIDNGLFGQMVLGEARLKWYRSQEYYDAGGWRGTWKMDGGGALANQTVHNIDLLGWFMGAPRQVCGQIGTFTHDIETEDLGMAMITFASGAVGTVLGTTTHPTGPYWAMELHGSEGGVHADLSGNVSWYFRDGFEEREQQLQRLTPHRNVIEDVVSAVRNGTPLACDGAQGRRSIALLDAIYTSSRQGSTPVVLDA
jgi:predicted dehydrogenase